MVFSVSSSDIQHTQNNRGLFLHTLIHHWLFQMRIFFLNVDDRYLPWTFGPASKRAQSIVFPCNIGLVQSGCRKEKNHNNLKQKSFHAYITHTRTRTVTAFSACQDCCDGCRAVLEYQLRGKHMNAAMMNMLNTDSTLSCRRMVGCQGWSLTTAEVNEVCESVTVPLWPVGGWRPVSC